MDERIRQQIEFIIELDKLKQVTRQNYLTDGSRMENDTEHSWHLAVMCMLLSEYANEEIDVFRTMCMVLIHDVIEIDAGDTYAYDTAGKETQREREEQAADRLFQLLPEDQGKWMRELWEEFEARETPEAKFARTMDNMQPLLLNHTSDGKSWKEHGIRREQVMERNRRTREGSEQLWKVCSGIIEENVEKGNIKK